LYEKVKYSSCIKALKSVKKILPKGKEYEGIKKYASSMKFMAKFTSSAINFAIPYGYSNGDVAAHLENRADMAFDMVKTFISDVTAELTSEKDYYEDRLKALWVAEDETDAIRRKMEKRYRKELSKRLLRKGEAKAEIADDDY
ncbi:MAG: hypothetical protein QXN59_03220, partial [Candidatus Micrarchaeaceae archaeon]